MISAQQLDALDPQMRKAMQSLMTEMAARDEQLRAMDTLIAQRDHEIAFKQALIDKLTHEMAVLKRLKFAATSERFANTLSPEQRSLLEETLDTDIGELGGELARRRKNADKKDDEKTQPKRAPLPTHLPRRDVPHEPTDTTCDCGESMQRIGEDVAEKLDYQPGVFSVERHVRGKWVCKCCERIVQAPVPAHVIDKGIPTAGLLAHLLVAKFMDHLPLYRQEAVFARAGHLIARSTLAQWVGECGAQLQPLVQALADELRRHMVLHADETPVAMLKPGNGKTHRAYMWSYCTPSTNPIKAVVFEFSETRSGENVREFLRLDTSQAWQGTLVTDGFSGYSACVDKGVTSAQCMAHSRRKFHELWANHGSQVGEQALRFYQSLFRIERQIEQLTSDERRRNAEVALEFKRRDIVLGLRHQVHGQEPLGQRQLAGLEDRAAEHAALVATGAALEVEPFLPTKLAVPTILATRAEEAFGPAPATDRAFATFMRPIEVEELQHRQTSLVLNLVLRHDQPPISVGTSSQRGGSQRELPPGVAEHSC